MAENEERVDQRIETGVDEKRVRPEAQASLVLQESIERYRALADATFEAIFISQKGVCLDTNPAATRMFGHAYEELIGIFGTDVISPETFWPAD